jgi:thioesterase domain-containing protein
MSGGEEADLQAYLHEHIPLSKAMDVRVEQASSDEVVLSAPLAPNINHRDTVFGGSASALAILAAWALVHVRFGDDAGRCRVVIQRNSMEYLKPIFGRFAARCTIDDGETWSRFLRMLARKGRARLRLSSVLEAEGERVGVLEGEFVAFVHEAG